MLGYLSLDIICSEKRTVFQERSSKKTVSFGIRQLKQIFWRVIRKKKVIPFFPLYCLENFRRAARCLSVSLHPLLFMMNLKTVSPIPPCNKVFACSFLWELPCPISPLVPSCVFFFFSLKTVPLYNKLWKWGYKMRKMFGGKYARARVRWGGNAKLEQLSQTGWHSKCNIQPDSYSQLLFERLASSALFSWILDIRITGSKNKFLASRIG